MAQSPVLDKVRALVAPIASDLQLDVYDIEQRGGTLRITLDTFPGTGHGIDLEQLALATRLISREFDHTDPIPGRYTLEVSSPGIERPLRTPEHFARVIGETVTVRLVAPDADGQRRFEGRLLAADDTTATVLTDTGERIVSLAQIERAKTLFQWGPAPKPGKGPSTKRDTPANNPAAASDDTDFEDTDDTDEIPDDTDEIPDEFADDDDDDGEHVGVFIDEEETP